MKSEGEKFNTENRFDSPWILLSCSTYFRCTVYTLFRISVLRSMDASFRLKHCYPEQNIVIIISERVAIISVDISMNTYLAPVTSVTAVTHGSTLLSSVQMIFRSLYLCGIQFFLQVRKIFVESQASWIYGQNDCMKTLDLARLNWRRANCNLKEDQSQ